jgi:transcriptional regulator with XRE-family HTH domain
MQLTLKAIRINRRLSQEEASKLIGISTDTLSNYERGKSFPDIPILKKIEEIYGVSYDNINFFPQ